MSLSERLRANVEAAPWVIEEVRSMEAENERLRARVDSLEDSLSNSVNADWHNEEIERLTRNYEVLDERYWKSAADRTEIEYWRQYAAAIETERDEARAHLTIRRTELEHTYSEMERLESVVTDTDAAMYEANAEMERLREICDALYSDKERLREALERMTTDCMESDFNEHWDTFKNAEAVLAEKEDKT